MASKSVSAHVSGTDTETETPTTMNPKTSPRKTKNKNEIWASTHGPGGKLGSSKPAEPVPNVRATRSSSRQPRGAPPPEEAPPLPTLPARQPRSPARPIQPSTKSQGSPVRPRGRPSAPVSPNKSATASKPVSPKKATAAEKAAAAAVAAAEKPKTKTPRARTVSPAKRRLIADSPPPEHTLDPFPPAPPPMTVTDKPAVLNRYGQKVVAPVGNRQRMRQMINFLSDEGVENLVDFEDKLGRIKTWLDTNHPHMDGITPDHETDPENLCARVRYMIWIHENRIAEGAEQWFTRDQFPDSTSMIKPIRPNKNDQWRLNPDGTTLGRPLDPKNQVMQIQDGEIMAKNRAEKAAAAAKAAELAKASPNKAAAAAPRPRLPELPHAEVWHRKEAARFPYGETPHMEQVMSRQITADLARGREARDALQGGSFYTLKKVLGGMVKYLYPEQIVASHDPWTLPEIPIEEVLEADQIFHVINKQDTTGAKRKANPSRSRSPAKRVRG